MAAECDEHRIRGSFRDPKGYVYVQNGTILRQVNNDYKSAYDYLITTGLYDDLVRDGLLVSHTEESLDLADTDDAYKVIRPERLDFISYPYEWCFSQLRDAALLTCEVQRRSLEHGMSLKDGSAYNIQFMRGKPIFIDTLSFERYREGVPWTGYRQFCQHFLAPLALMSHTDIRLAQLLRIWIDGIPLSLATKLLPRRTYLNFGILTHLHFQAFSQNRRTASLLDQKIARTRAMSLPASLRLIQNLESTVKGLRYKRRATAWSSYSLGHESYSEEALTEKRRLVGEFVRKAAPRTAWDLGANTGEFSRILNANAPECVTEAWDSDPECIEIAYQRLRSEGDRRLFPLICDLTNPSGGIGWNNRERTSFKDRGPVDLVLALALIHHLAIGNNVPFNYLADFLAQLCKWLIIEFVPEDDRQVRDLLRLRQYMADYYDRQKFEQQFGQFFKIHRVELLGASGRSLYLMERTGAWDV